MSRKKKGWIAWSALAVITVGLVGFYRWVPWEYDFVPRTLPVDNPPTDPNSAALFQKGARVLVVTAHPDDAEFYAGGLLTQLGRSGAALTLIVCTDGDKGYYPFEDAERNRKVRRREQVDAASAWGCHRVHFLGFPDGRLEASNELVASLVEQILELRPDYIVTFDGDYPPRLSHGDHRRVGEAMQQASLKAGVSHWLIRFSTIAPNWYRGISEEWDDKKNLLAVHKSQFYGDRLKRIEAMVGGTARKAGESSGNSYAEGFRCSRTVSP